MRNRVAAVVSVSAGAGKAVGGAGEDVAGGYKDSGEVFQLVARDLKVASILSSYCWP